MNFDELDDLFKQGLNNREIPFDPSSWAKMNAALNKANPSFWAKAIKAISAMKTTAVAASVTAGIVASSAAFYAVTTDGDTNKIVAETPTNVVVEVAQATTESTTSPATIELVPYQQEEQVATEAAVIEEISVVASSPAAATADEYYNESIAEAQIENIEASEVELQKMIVLGLAQNDVERSLSNADKRSKIRNEKAKVKRTSFDVFAGLNMSQGLLNTGTNRSRPDQNIVVGLQANRAVTKSLSVSAGLLYQQREGLNSSKTYTSTTYSFGKTVESTELEAISLHCVEMPVFVSYKISKLHTVYGGAYAAYLLNAKSAVKTSSNLPDATPSTAEAWGYSKGFSSTDFGAMAGYAFNVFPKLQLGVRMNYGFKDLTENSYYGNNSFDNNLQVRFVLDYKLSKI